MYWENNKNNPGWCPIWMSEDVKYRVAMQILYPQSHHIFMEYWSRACKRISLGLSDENLPDLLILFNSKYKYELWTLFFGMTNEKRASLINKTLAKISMGKFYCSNLKKESFIDIWRNPDIYKVIEWDITAPWDSEKNEYIVEKAKYSICYEQFRNPIKTTNRPKSTLELDRVLNLMKNAWKVDKKATYLAKTGNEYYLNEFGRVKMRRTTPKIILNEKK
jgi:hypothetical protein